MNKIVQLIIALLAITNTIFAQTEPNYLCFEVDEGTEISLVIPNSSSTNNEYFFKEDVDIKYSYDKEQWIPLTKNKTITIFNHCLIYFKGRNNCFYKIEDSKKYIVSFKVTKPFKCFGNIMTLIDEIGETTELTEKYAFAYLFQSNPLITAPELPATTLTEHCYEGMFKRCYQLLKAPSLPATTLADYCYLSMFYDCDKLMYPPELPAISLTLGCYENMFGSCQNLSIPPELPATSLAEDCYAGMFANCDNLLITPELPATILAKGCYRSMFYHCDQLETTPLLPAKNWVKDSYTSMFYACKNLKYTAPIYTQQGGGNTDNMFYMCSKLQYISVRFVLWWGNGSKDWVKDVSPKGTFVCPDGLVEMHSESHIPKGWTVKRLSELTFYNINIPQETRNNIIIPSTTDIEASTEMSFYVKDRTSEGYTIENVSVVGSGQNPIPLTNEGNIYKFTMPEEDVYIEVSYTSVSFSITVDNYSSTDKTTANVGDVINVTFKDRAGYNLTSATYNGTALTITNNASQFTMPAANVTISTTHTPIEYKITAGEFVTVDKTKATINDQVSFTVEDRTNNGYKLDKVLVNNTEFTGTSFNMADYLKDVTITAQYSKIGYTITTDAYSSTNKTTANVGDEITVTFANRDGYSLTSATYNGTALNITNNTASFTMPAANVIITTTYTKIDYTITADQYSTPNKTTANVGDEITVTFANRDGYSLTSATYNGTALNIINNTATFTMPAANVTIATTYTKIDYTITADQYSTPNKTTANVGDEITVTFTNRDGYNLTSATYNGNPLTITNNTASFTMPAANVSIATTYTPIEYNVTVGEYVTANKTKATINDQVSFTVADRTADGYQLDKVLINNTEFSGTTFNMADYLTDVTITAVYSKINYSIITDEYSSADKNNANVGDKINVNFSNIPGHYIFRAVCNGNELIVEDYGSWFTMPAENAYVATSYLPIEYNITAGEYVTANKAKATINDQVSFTVADRTADDYQLNKVLINNTEISGTSFNMADYLTDVTITAVYSKIGYTITSDVYSTPSKTKANVGDEITVTFSKRDGYNLTSATYNGTALTIVDYKSQFTMPDEDVEIKTVYTVEQQQITKPEIITDNNVEITLPENLTENTEVTFTVQQKPGYTAFVYVNGVLTNEYKFVFTGKVEIKVDYKELTVSNISAETESYCAGDEINLTFATNPYAVEYELTFSNEAQKEGFENIDFHPVASYEKQPASFKIPQSAKPGKYHAFIRVKDSKDSHSKQYAFDFEVLYPTDIIETKYSDLICVNNSKNEYIGYQWFKNNKEIKGADKQFYIDAPLLNGSYSVALILKNGEKIRTCNYIVSNPTLKKSLKPSVNVYPNPAKASAPIVVELSEMDDLTDAYILIYNQLGVQIDKISNLTPHNTLSLKKGFYHGVVICGSTKLTFKIIVNE